MSQPVGALLAGAKHPESAAVSETAASSNATASYTDPAFLKSALDLLNRFPATTAWGLFASSDVKILIAAQDLRKAIQTYIIEQAATSVKAPAPPAPPSAALAPPPPPPPPPPPMVAPAPPASADGASDTAAADIDKLSTATPARARRLAARAQLLNASDYVVRTSPRKPLAPTSSNGVVSKEVLQKIVEGNTPLRRTQVQRSPGGTPARARRSPRVPVSQQDIIAHALKKKFKAAHSPSSPRSPMNDGSPYTPRARGVSKSGAWSTPRSSHATDDEVEMLAPAGEALAFEMGE